MDERTLQAVLDALEKEREYLLESKQYGAEHILAHHAIRVVESLKERQEFMDWMTEKAKEML